MRGPEDSAELAAAVHAQGESRVHRLFKDPGFLSWMALLALPFPFLLLQNLFSARVATAFLTVGCGIALGFFRVLSGEASINEVRPRFSLLQLLVGTFSAGIEVGLMVGFVQSHDVILLFGFFVALIVTPVLSAVCLGLLR
jgi:hypothetical protein